MTDPHRTDLVTRDQVLSLLSDEEVARVSTAETASHLSVGDEYVDLKHLSLGVRRAGAAPLTMNDVLPRKAVQESTWTKVLTHLPARSDV